MRYTSFPLQNPKKGDPRGVGLDDKADFSPQKQKQFGGKEGGYAWAGANDPTLLDYKNCELLLIAASKDVQGELSCICQAMLHASQMITGVGGMSESVGEGQPAMTGVCTTQLTLDSV